LTPRLPAGAVIVLVAAAVFLASMLFGTARGVLVRRRAHIRLQRKVGRQNLLRAVFEIQEAQCRRDGQNETGNVPVVFKDVLAQRSWTVSQLRRLVARARREEMLLHDGATIQLTESGFGHAARDTRNHRLWETYLITHADVAPQHVDSAADLVEHVLGPEMVRKLEDKLARSGRDIRHVVSPHELKGREIQP
jgi:manganese/zinc/iron transport system permease protein